MPNEKTLEAQLKEKEELVAALTERLEMAAEQLDRLHRTGADRGARGGGGGLPAELIERHESLVDDLQRAVQQWEEMQAGVALGSLQAQVSELRDMVSAGLTGGRRPPTAGPVVPSDDAGADADDVDSPPADEQDRWAALKSYLLEDEGEPEGKEAAAKSSPAGEAGDGRNAALLPSPPPEPLETVAPPVPVDAGVADEALLWSAIESRDEYIAFLIRRLRHASSHPPLPVNWGEWESMPDALCRKVDELQAQLNETLRLSEVELSLERARLGREESRIRQMEENARKTMRQLGLDPDVDVDADLELEHDAGTGNRWLRMLGIGREDDDEDEG